MGFISANCGEVGEIYKVKLAMPITVISAQPPLPLIRSSQCETYTRSTYQSAKALQVAWMYRYQVPRLLIRMCEFVYQSKLGACWTGSIQAYYSSFNFRAAVREPRHDPGRCAVIT